MRRLIDWLRRLLDDGEAYQVQPSNSAGRYVCGEFVPLNEEYGGADEEKLLSELVTGGRVGLRSKPAPRESTTPSLSHLLRRQLQRLVRRLRFWKRPKLDVVELVRRYDEYIASLSAALIEATTPPPIPIDSPNSDVLEVEAAILQEMRVALGHEITLNQSRREDLQQWARGEGGLPMGDDPKKIAAVLLVKWGEVGGGPPK